MLPARLSLHSPADKHERHRERATFFVKMRLAFTAIALVTAWGHVRGDPTDERQPPPLVTCGSPIRLTHASTGHQLLSDTIAWDSLRQSITAEVSQTGKHTVWMLVERSNGDYCATGTPVACGSVVRLLHAETRKFLHSRSQEDDPSARGVLSRNQEACAAMKEGINRTDSREFATDWCSLAVSRGSVFGVFQCVGFCGE